ncbi:SDR family oxidoreductase [Rhodopila sp.]|jgi:NAD(P)-dependent dehydrogenase (short-subunit alcohol dehydrogenase family)|uniref:SDR family oxidoreductase n=1 Tax=Rhodopila sp. TaxID=2480087 RepID=UPI002BCF518D|nr:SDR family oxidoreductase [Rhodopila sp.]HVZ07052.1 SDR family oxidoreductase [Rhodopila sp.]
MEVRLDGRTAIITGASKGLGFAMAKEFAASGAHVAMLARTRDTLDEAVAAVSQGASGQAAGFVCDVARADEIRTAFDAVIQRFGKVDILINNAGISRAMPSEQITDDIWQEDLELKLFAAIRLSRLVWPGMKERKWGRIINVLNSGAKAPRANGAPTAVSRAAGMALMKVLSNEGAPHGILVNGMLVGLIDSDQHVRRHRREGANVSYDDFKAKMGAGVPLGRIGRPEEFAAMACLLCSDLGGFTTGTAINMDGGATPVV